MAKGNNKPKGNGKKGPPKGTCPPHLVPYQIKPGEVRNPKGISRRSVTSHLQDFFDEKVTRTLEDGSTEVWPRAKVIAWILGTMAMKGPTEVPDSNWQTALKQTLDRVDPVPRETTFAVNVQTEHTAVAIGFCERIRQRTGRQDISHTDVREEIERQAFGGNGRERSGDGG